MLNKFNLALTPHKKGEEVVQLASQIALLADHYLLGKNSLPHVTLYHFELEEFKIDYIWQKACDSFAFPPIELEFKKFSYKTYDNLTYWIALMPNNTAILQEMHERIAHGIGLPVKPSFEPHMTLLNTKETHCESEIERLSKTYTPIIDHFTLTLGRSDEVGQFTEILYRQNLITTS